MFRRDSLAFGTNLLENLLMTIKYILEFSLLVHVVLYFPLYITFSLDSNCSMNVAIRNLMLLSISEFLNSSSAFHPTEAAQNQAFL